VSTRRAVPLGLAVLLAFLSVLSPFSIDTFFPALRSMQAEFGVSPLQIQQTVTAYLLPYAIFSLVHGPLSDAIGRRPVVIAGLTAYSLASFACAFTPGFYSLLAFRAVQGMTAGAGMAVGRAVVRDLYDGPEAQRLSNAVTMFFSIAPAIAPVLGGWLYVAFGWRSVFFFLALLGCSILLASWRQLAETLPPEARLPVHAGTLVAQSWQIACNREFLLLACASGLCFCSIMSFIGAAPAIVLDHWHLAPTQFAALFLPVILGFLLGAFASSRMAGRYTSHGQVHIGFGLCIGGAFGGVLLHALLPDPPLVLQQVQFLLQAVGVQCIVPVLTLRMLDLYPGARGSAASVQAFTSLMLTSFAVGVLAPLLGGSMLEVVSGSLGASLLSLGLWILADRADRADRAARRHAA
jgi:DHA1 family bicyclomycin/chloramphenicol resistance-like MFS transporter